MANSCSNYSGFIFRTLHTATLSFPIRMTPVVTIHCRPMGLASGHWQLNASHYTWFMSLNMISITKSCHGNTYTGPLWREWPVDSQRNMVFYLVWICCWTNIPVVGDFRRYVAFIWCHRYDDENAKFNICCTEFMRKYKNILNFHHISTLRWHR